MSGTVQGHYEGVRFAPSLSRSRPFQILGFTEDYAGNVDSSLLVFLDLEQATDLHRSLGLLLINNIEVRDA